MSVIPLCTSVGQKDRTVYTTTTILQRSDDITKGKCVKLWDRLAFPERKKCPLAKYQPVNSLSPKSDQHEISPYNVNALENRVVMRIEFIIREDESIITVLTRWVAPPKMFCNWYRI